jgi:hypothetical protein
MFLWLKCNVLSHEKADLDKAVTHLSEAVLLTNQPSDLIHRFFMLADLLLIHFLMHGQPEDVESSLKYFCFLQAKICPFGEFNMQVIHGFHASVQPTRYLVSALAAKLRVGSRARDMLPDIREMAALVDKLRVGRKNLSEARIFETRGA